MKKYYLIQWTWGILVNIVGGIIYFILTKIGNYRTYKYRNMYCVVLPWNISGMNLGMFTVHGESCPKSIISHEYGHSIQNLKWGILTPFIISIPSFIRCCYREVLKSLNHPPKTNYYNIWFEANATELGRMADEEKWDWI